jgi:hypothetical protein
MSFPPYSPYSDIRQQVDFAARAPYDPALATTRDAIDRHFAGLKPDSYAESRFAKDLPGSTLAALTAVMKPYYAARAQRIEHLLAPPSLKR